MCGTHSQSFDTLPLRCTSASGGVGPAPAGSIVKTVPSALPARRGAAGAALYRGAVTLFGGSNLSTPAYDEVWSYSVYAGRWLPRPPMPVPRAGHFALTVGGDVYIVGGTLANASTTRAVDVLGGASGVWASGPPLPSDDPVVGGVAMSAAAAAGCDALVLTGATDAASGALIVTPWGLRVGAWSAGAPSPPFPSSELLTPVQGAGAVGGAVYLFAQATIESLDSTVTVYDVPSDAWSRVPAAFPAPGGGFNAVMFGTVTVGARVLLLGGCDCGLSCGAGAAVLAWVPASGAWVAAPPLTRARCSPGVVLADPETATLMVVGGYADGPAVARDDAEYYDAGAA